MRRTLLILAAGAAAFANSLGGGFVYDDRPIIVENPMIRRLAFAPRLLTENYWNGGNAAEGRRGGLYRPLPLLTYALNYRVSGLRPFGYHAVNLIIHLAVSVLAYFLLAKVAGSEPAAFAASLIFAVLPIHAEAVSSIVGRSELLSAFFVLLAWLLAFREESPLKLAPALACFGLALFCKESAAVFPLALALSEGSPRKRAPVWAMFGMQVALYLYWRAVILGRVFSTGGGLYFAGKDALTVLLTMSRFAMAHYLFPMASGLGLCADFSRPVIPDAPPWAASAWLCLIALASLSLLAFARLLRTGSRAALGVCLFLVFILPVSNILVKIDLIGAERFLYLPSLGFCLLLGLYRRRLPDAIAAAVLAWWTGAAILRNQVWRSEDTLWAATVKAAPASPRAWNGLGTARAGEEARRCFRRALELDGAFPEAMYNLGKSYFDDGDYAEARRWVENAVSRTPEDKDALCLLGMIAEKRGDAREAIRLFRRALALNADYAAAHRNLGLLLYRLGRASEGKEELKLYLEDAPAGEETEDVRRFIGKI